MPPSFVRTLKALELEERLLNAGALIALLSVFLPWIGGDWLGGDSVSYSGFGFYTGFLGWAVFLLHLFLVLLTLVPLLGHASWHAYRDLSAVAAQAAKGR